MEPLAYRERDDAGNPVKMDTRLELLEQDIDNTVISDTLPDAQQITGFISRLQIVGNNVRKTKRQIVDNLERWKMRVDRLQRAVGGYEALGTKTGSRYSDTGSIRKDMRSVATSCWGPISATATSVDTVEIGIKGNLLPLEKDAAEQLAAYLIPTTAEGADSKIPEVVASFDDVIERYTKHRRLIEGLEGILEERHYDVAHLVKLLELESFEARKVQPAR